MNTILSKLLTTFISIIDINKGYVFEMGDSPTFWIIWDITAKF